MEIAGGPNNHKGSNFRQLFHGPVTRIFRYVRLIIENPFSQMTNRPAIYEAEICARMLSGKT